DLDAALGQAVAERYGGRWFADFANLLNRVDAVSVATPTPTHFGLVAECLRRDVNVLAEKPLAASVAEGRELVRLARSHSLVFQVGHIERFNPAFLELQSILDGMETIAIDARRLSPFDTSNTDVDVVLDL